MTSPQPRRWVAFAVFAALSAAIFLLIAFAGFTRGVDMLLAVLLVVLTAGVSYGNAKRRR